MDLQTLERDPQLVAVRLAASELFGVLQRSVRLPSGFGALVIRDDASTQLVPAGGSVDARLTREVVAIRATPLELSFDNLRGESSDGFACDARLDLSLQVVPERSEYEAFCRVIKSSGRRADLARLALHVQDAVEKAVHDFAATRPIETLLHSRSDAEFSDALAAALKPVTFPAGLALGRTVRLDIRSPAWLDAQHRAQLDAAEKQRMQADQQRREAAGQARLRHVEQLSSLLNRLDDMTRERPGVSTADLIRTFDAAERAELYRQLLSREISSRRTAAIAVVAGTELLLFDPNDGSVQLRRAFDGPLGPLRSVRLTKHDGVDGLLLGAARGVHHFVPMTGRVTSYAFDPPDKLRGGVNAAVILDGILYATHSEVGVLRWETDSPHPGRTILSEHTTGAASIRDIQADDHGTLWFTAADRVIGWNPRNEDSGFHRVAQRDSLDDKSLSETPSPQPSPLKGEGGIRMGNSVSSVAPNSGVSNAQSQTVGAIQSTQLPAITASPSASSNASPPPLTGTLISIGSIAGSGAPRIAALHVANDTVFAGTTDGRLLAWPCNMPDRIETLLSGEGGAVESVQWLSGLGVERLLVACRRPAAWLLVRNESCRVEYRCDDPLRWASATDDWIIGVTDRRDRLHLWRPARPEAVERTIWAARLVGHSIQDAAAVGRT